MHLGRILVGAVAIFYAGSFLARAEQSLPQQYLQIYLKLNEAEKQEKNKAFAAALQGFKECYAELTKIKTANPEWETALVEHRLADFIVKMRELGQKVPGVEVPTQIEPKREKNPAVYNWKAEVPATLFWIGKEAAGSVWNANWVRSNGGPDSPSARNGYATADHASGVNPFYVALPFDDLAYPEKARRWVPMGWQRPAVNGKAVSACKDRWVEIKNKDGDSCYAQWEDAGPSQRDAAECVFGDARPLVDTALAYSPAVAQYLQLNGTNNFVSWRFVDTEDVRPGPWLKLDEQAVIYTAMHEQ